MALLRISPTPTSTSPPPAPPSHLIATMPRLPKPNLLLCFDAFGTLFSPSSPVAAQYATVARQCGLTVSLPDLEKHLFAAIREERKLNPNYGNATGLGATQWWTNIIHKTFTPLLPPSQPIPPSLTPSLLHRFASNEGYSASPTLTTTIRHLKHHAPFSRVIIGIITNSDDRVPSILTSLGLNVSPTRYGDPLDSGDYDIDFTCMSYDVGAEKPDSTIFKAAEDLVSLDDTWENVYVGDEWDKDVVGAQKAGWDPILLDVDGERDVIPLKDVKPCSVGELFGTHKVVKVRSLEEISTWFTTKS